MPADCGRRHLRIYSRDGRGDGSGLAGPTFPSAVVSKPDPERIAGSKQRLAVRCKSDLRIGRYDLVKGFEQG